jgi:hypothetical protein
MKYFVVSSFLSKFPIKITKIHWRRCPFIRQKLELKKVLRLSSVIQNRVQKNNNEYFLKTIETLINTELPILPFLKNFEELYLINEIVLFFIYQDDFRKIKDKKYQLNIIICILQIFLKRLIIPLFIKIILFYINKMDNE